MATPQLAQEDVAEIVEVVRKGLGAAHWSPKVYDFLTTWCDQVEEALSDGEEPPDLLEGQEAARSAPKPPAPRPAPPGAQPRRPHPPSRPPRPEREGELHCPKHDGGDGRWLPKAAFRRRNDRPGKYQSWCRDCLRSYAASKYLSAATLAALATDGLLVATLAPTSWLLAKPCPWCAETWRPTDRIVAGGIVVCHKECLSTEETHEHETD